MVQAGRLSSRLPPSLRCGMRASKSILAAIVLSSVLLCGCGGGGSSTSTPVPTAVAPTITTTNAQNGAVVVSLATTTTGTTIYYTIDGTTPTNSSQIYQAPFLVASNLTVKAVAM